jgi:phthiodiolone/phenolphthiodiolone dimycocerosates ketoreductase
MAIEVGAAGGVTPPVDALIKTAKRNEEKGYDAIWYPDHWMAWHPESIWQPDITPIAQFQPNPHVYLDPVACIAAVGVHTDRIKLGTCVTETVRRHPAMLANEWLTLDHLTKGRAILGVGSGEKENIEPYGMRYEKVVSRFEESLTIIRLLWENDEPVDFDGQFWTLRDAVNGMGAYVPGQFPAIWTGAHGPRMCEITGRLADGWLPALMTPDQYREKLSLVRASAEKAGRTVKPGLWHYAVVAEDHEETHRLLDSTLIRAYMLVLGSAPFERHGYDHPLGKGFDGVRDYIPTRVSREVALKAAAEVPEEVLHETILHGTPDEIVERAREYEAIGCEHIVLWNITFLADISKVRESYHLMDEVLTALKS